MRSSCLGNVRNPACANKCQLNQHADMTVLSAYPLQCPATAIASRQQLQLLEPSTPWMRGQHATTVLHWRLEIPSAGPRAQLSFWFRGILSSNRGPCGCSCSWCCHNWSLELHLMATKTLLQDKEAPQQTPFLLCFCWNNTSEAVSGFEAYYSGARSIKG